MLIFFLLAFLGGISFNLIGVDAAEVSEYVSVVTNDSRFLPEDSNRKKFYDGLSVNAVQVKKCCPLGYTFDVDTLVCRALPNFGNSEEKMKHFLKSYIRNYNDSTDYSVSYGIPSCADSHVFISRVTRDLTCDPGGARADGKIISSDYCIDGKDGYGTVYSTCEEANKVCGSRSCFRKCLPFGKFFGMSDEGLLELPPFEVDFHDLKTLEINRVVKLSDFGIYFGNKCGGRGRLPLIPEDDPDDINYLGTDGRLFVPKPEEDYYKDEEYCLENLKSENSTEVISFVCVPVPPSKLTYYLLAVGFLLSCISLLATFLVYLFSRRSRNLYGKTLMCYVFSLFCACLSLAIVQLASDSLGKTSCIAAGYSTLFFFLAAFFWLNIMSMDIWKTFRSLRLARFNNPVKEKIQFLWYSLYAWSFPCIISGICAATDFVPGFLPRFIKPDFGEQSCWFSKFTYGIHLFFITPISLILICNTILFVCTAWRCWKIKSEIIRMGNHSKKKFTTKKSQFGINCKLFIVMGVVWSLEIISFFFEHPIWKISDTANALHGVLIFIIFVMKKKVLADLPEGVKKPFIRMKNIRKKPAEQTTEDDTTANRKLSRSSSTNVTDMRIIKKNFI